MSARYMRKMGEGIMKNPLESRDTQRGGKKHKSRKKIKEETMAVI